MYCPSCGEQFGGTGTECPGCGAALTEARPGPPGDPTIALTSVFAAGDPAALAMAKSILDAAGIEYFVRGEGLQDLFGSGRVGAGYNLITGPAEVVVREDDAQSAREILRDLLTSDDTTPWEN